MRKHILHRKSRILPWLVIVIVFGVTLFIFRSSFSIYRPNNILDMPVYKTQNPDALTPISTNEATESTKLLTLRMFFVALNDNGKNGEQIGCGDTSAPVNIDLPDSANPLEAVMSQLVGLKQQTVGPSKLYNSLSQSKLTVKDAMVKDGVAVVHLTGTLSLAGECDNPRFKSQLEKTAGQFSDVNSVQIFINDKPLDEALSLK